MRSFYAEGTGSDGGNDMDYFGWVSGCDDYKEIKSLETWVHILTTLLPLLLLQIKAMTSFKVDCWQIRLMPNVMNRENGMGSNSLLSVELIDAQDGISMSNVIVRNKFLPKVRNIYVPVTLRSGKLWSLSQSDDIYVQFHWNRILPLETSELWGIHNRRWNNEGQWLALLMAMWMHGSCVHHSMELAQGFTRTHWLPSWGVFPLAAANCYCMVA
jgi:hypothetical protein